MSKPTEIIDIRGKVALEPRCQDDEDLRCKSCKYDDVLASIKDWIEFYESEESNDILGVKRPCVALLSILERIQEVVKQARI